MEIRISRDGLDHILDAVQTQTRVGAGRHLPKVRTTSHMRPVRRNGAAFRPPRPIPPVSPLRPHVDMIEDQIDLFERSLRYKGPARH
jgi:hypothetical protein